MKDCDTSYGEDAFVWMTRSLEADVDRLTEERNTHRTILKWEPADDRNMQLLVQVAQLKAELVGAHEAWETMRIEANRLLEERDDARESVRTVQAALIHCQSERRMTNDQLERVSEELSEERAHSSDIEAAYRRSCEK